MLHLDEVTRLITLDDGDSGESAQALADRYARTHRAHAALEQEMAGLKARVAALGVDRIDGTDHYLRVSSRPGGRRLDGKALAQHLKVPQDLLDRFTKVGAPSVSITVFGL